MSGLEINEHPSLQEASWRIQRAGWAIGAAVLIAAMLGAAGRGPLSARRVDVGDASIRYERFVRRDTRTDLDLVLPARPGHDVTVRLSGDYVRGVRVAGLEPPPRLVACDGEGWTAVYPVGDAPGPARVRIGVYPRAGGNLAGTVRLSDGPSVEIRQFVLP